jgi:hypothetical protein
MQLEFYISMLLATMVLAIPVPTPQYYSYMGGSVLGATNLHLSILMSMLGLVARPVLHPRNLARVRIELLLNLTIESLFY